MSPLPTQNYVVHLVPPTWVDNGQQWRGQARWTVRRGLVEVDAHGTTLLELLANPSIAFVDVVQVSTWMQNEQFADLILGESLTATAEVWVLDGVRFNCSDPLDAQLIRLVAVLARGVPCSDS